MTGCTQLCRQGRGCTCGTPPEAGNLWIPVLDTPISDADPFTASEHIIFWALIVLMAICSIIVSAVGCAFFAHWMRWIA